MHLFLEEDCLSFKELNHVEKKLYHFLENNIKEKTKKLVCCMLMHAYVYTHDPVVVIIASPFLPLSIPLLVIQFFHDNSEGILFVHVYKEGVHFNSSAFYVHPI